MWHAHYDQSKRSPYAAIQTSLGCQFSCNFCMIMMEDGKKVTGQDQNMEVFDIAELIAERI